MIYEFVWLRERVCYSVMGLQIDSGHNTRILEIGNWKVTIIEELNMEFTKDDFGRLLFAENNQKAAEENWKLEIGKMGNWNTLAEV
jgi:hypothetical protein